MRVPLRLILVILYIVGFASAALSNNEIVARTPVLVQFNESFPVDVSLNPAEPNFKDVVRVSAGENPKVRCVPHQFELKPGATQRVMVTVVSSETALAVLFFYADNWEPFMATIMVKGPVPRVTSTPDSFESRNNQPFNIALTDGQGNVLTAESSAFLEFEVTNLAIVSQENGAWSSKYSVPVKFNDTLSRSIILRGNSWSAEEGRLTIRLMNQELPAFSKDISIHLKPPWYVPLIVAIAGGLSHSAWQLLRNMLSRTRKRSRRNQLKALAKAGLLGFGAGSLAYLLADWNVLGIKGDTTGLRGFFILGVLFSYVGTDFILGAATKVTKRS